MSEIKLVKRFKYAGDVHAALMQLGWDAKTAAAFLDSIPDADAVEVVRCKDCVTHGNCLTEDTFRIARIDNPFCCGGKRRADK